MSNVLAALFGGLGAGASSYGTQRIREQEQERLAQQRMAELQQQEQARLAQVREKALADETERKRINSELTSALKVMGLEVPAGAALTRETMPYITQQQITARQAQQQAEKDRLAREQSVRQNRATYNAAMQAGRIPKTVEYSDDVNFTEMLKDGRIEDGQSNALLMQSNAIAAQAARAADAAARAAQSREGQQSVVKDRMMMNLGSEYEKTAEKRRNLYGTIETAVAAAPDALKGNGAAQASLLYGFITSLDPESTVREGEIDLMRKAAPILQNAKAQYNALVNGKAALVTPQLVQQMQVLMTERAKRQAARDATIRTDYLSKAGRLGIPDADAFFPEFIPESYRPRPPLSNFVKKTP